MKMQLHPFLIHLRQRFRAAVDVLALGLLAAIWALNDRSHQREWEERRSRRRLDPPATDARLKRTVVKSGSVKQPASPAATA